MKTGRDGPVGDVEDLGHLRQGEVEVVVQHQDGPPVDVQLTEFAEHPFTLGHVRRGVGCAGDSGVGRHVKLDLGPPALLAGRFVAGTHRQPSKPGVPGIGVTECAHVPPREEKRILEGILGTMRIAEDELGDAFEPRRRYLHQLCEGIEVTGPGPLDEVSLHGRHRCGARHFLTLSHSMGRQVAEPFPLNR